MTKSRLVLAILSVVPLVACTPSVVRTSGDGTSGTKPYLCIKNQPCEISIIDVFSTDGQNWTGQIDRDPIYLASDNQDVDIFWKLPEHSDLGFCKQNEDGVFLKPESPNDGQFGEMGATGTARGAGGQCKDKYHWKAKNTNHGQSYRYKVQFRDSQRIYIIDPWIVNGK
jgi:hypothetical protein